MALNQFNQSNESSIQKPAESNIVESKKQPLFLDAENKIQILKDFLITGDIINDYNYLLDITNRNVNYKKATSEPKEELLKNLEYILTSLLENQNEKKSDLKSNEGEKMFYDELPKIEINVITKLIEFYK